MRTRRGKYQHLIRFSGDTLYQVDNDATYGQMVARCPEDYYGEIHRSGEFRHNPSFKNHPPYPREVGVVIPKRVDEFRSALESQRVVSPEECDDHTPKGIDVFNPDLTDIFDKLGEVFGPPIWEDIPHIPVWFPGMKRDITPEGDVVEAPIQPEVCKMSESVFDDIVKTAVKHTPIRSLTQFGIETAAKIILDEVGPKAIVGFQYADWIMDNSEKRFKDLIEAMKSDTPIPRRDVRGMEITDRTQIAETIAVLNSELVKHGVSFNNVYFPRQVEDQEITVYEEVLAKHNLDPSDHLVGDDDEILKNLRRSVLNELDDWKRKVDIYHGCDLLLGEARLKLLDRQFKHVRRYAKTIIKRVTGYGDDWELVHLDLAQQDHFGFLTRDRDSHQHTRHFTVKLVDYNWIIVEENGYA